MERLSWNTHMISFLQKSFPQGPIKHFIFHILVSNIVFQATAGSKHILVWIYKQLKKTHKPKQPPPPSPPHGPPLITGNTSLIFQFDSVMALEQIFTALTAILYWYVPSYLSNQINSTTGGVVK